MKKIQLITNLYMKNFCEENFGEYMQISTITYPDSFDDFKINIFLLTHREFFELQNSRFKYKKEYENISKMIANCKKTTFIFVLPNNLNFNNNSCIIDHPEYVTKVLESICETKKLSIYYENTHSQIQNLSVNSCFVFDENDNYQPLTFSTSGKFTTIKDNDRNIYYTTLDIDKHNTMLEFMKELKLLNIDSNIPKWLNDYNFLDDDEQKQKVEYYQKQMIESKEQIEIANKKIEDNLRYKKVLITSGDELVNIVFDMLEDIFDISLKNYEEVKKEDFLFEIGNYTYIGEIKGVSDSVKRGYVSQTNSHRDNYCDNLDDKELKNKKTKAILIINYQRKRAIEDRDDIDKEVIKYAKKLDILIIDSKTFLTLYEYIKQDYNCKKKVIDLINNSIGLLNINELNI